MLIQSEGARAGAAVLLRQDFFNKLYNKQQREAELAEQEYKRQEEDRQRSIVEQEKQRLLAEHAAILQQHHPKANSQYMGGFQRWAN